MKRLLIVPLMALAIGATIMLAQSTSTNQNQNTARTPPSPQQMAQHRVEMLTAMLSLTTAQQQQATTIFTDAATAAQAVHTNMRTAHDALRTAVMANNAAGIDTAATTIGSLTGQVASIEAKADAAFNQLLTADQQTKLSQLGQAGFRPGGPHGGFGFGGRGGAPPMGAGPGGV